MKPITFKIDEMLENEMNDFLKTTKTSKSAFIRTCIIEKLAGLRAYSYEKQKIEQLYNRTDKVARNG